LSAQLPRTAGASQIRETCLKRELSPSAIDSKILEKLGAIVGPEWVSVKEIDRISYGRDASPVSMVAATEGSARFQPAAIVWPGTTEQVAEVCRLAYSNDITMIPFGAGSGVCGGTLALNGGIVVDVKRMNRVLEIDEESHTVTAECGIIGETLERELMRHGYTLGHFPSSVYCSTLGGYLAARSAGQFSSKYGKIEDMVVAIEAVFPKGEIVNTLVTPKAATGPDWNQVMVGSEGTLGFITKGTCRIWPAPESRRFLSFIFRDAMAGTEAMRTLLRHDIRPAGLRLYDEIDTTLVGTSGKTGKGNSPLDFISVGEFGNMVRGLVPGLFKKTERFFAKKADLINRLDKFARQGCLMVMVFEGEARLVDYEYELATTLCENLGGTNRGPELAVNWWENRYHVSYKQTKVYYHGAFVDTIEVATTWDKLARLYEEVKEAVSPLAFIMAHFSHAYTDGCSIYFTFVTAADNPFDMERAHHKIWDAAMEATLRVGGTISHHHGVGLSKARFMKEEHGSAMGIYQAIKDELDPKNLCNPGKMGLKS
jgi:alkyldihydroxyacetonephosphate synthase